MKLLFASLLFAVSAQPSFTPPQARSAYIITGEVRDRLGETVCGVRVCAYPNDSDLSKPGASVRCAVSGADGKFVINLEKAGTYNLIYDQAEKGYVSQLLCFFRNPSTGIPQAVVSDLNPTALVTVFLPAKNGLLKGKLVDRQTGLPIESAKFLLCHAANPGICWPVSAKGADGKFMIHAPYVPFTLTIKADGFNDWAGLSGEDKETAINVAAETRMELIAFLKRQPTTVSRAISESEKQAGVNLAAPIQVAPADETVFDKYPRLTKLEWAPVDGAVSYAVEVDYCRGFGRKTPECINPQPLALKSNPPTSGITGTAYEFGFIGAQPGRWRVWSLDNEGREGFKSPWRRFVYLR